MAPPAMEMAAINALEYMMFFILIFGLNGWVCAMFAKGVN